jgi:hypothetical protein
MQTKLSRTLSAVLPALVLMTALPARAAGELVDEKTGTKFDAVQTAEGAPYQCLGAGVRLYELLGFIPIQIYAATLCVEPTGFLPIATYAKTKGGGSAEKLEADQGFYDAIYNAPGGKMVVEHLVRSISREDMAKAFRESLGKVLPAEKVEKLISIIPGDPQKGQDVKIYSKGSTLVIDIGGKVNRLDDAEIAQKLWGVYLSADAVSPSLKKSIAQHLSTTP